MVESTDPESAAIIAREEQRREVHIELIASEDDVSRALRTPPSVCATRTTRRGVRRAEHPRT